ncbi:MAG: hypothetical protein AB7I19_00500 [Planctomycetota bacterium]
MRGLAVAVVTLCVVLLPALVAGWRLDAAPRAGEIERLSAALDAVARAQPGPDQLWTAATARTPVDAASLPAARIAALLAIFAQSALLFLAVAVARGRLIAAIACVAFATLPPIAVDGAILRPELAFGVFGTLALALLTQLPERQRTLRSRSRAIAWGWLSVHVLAVGIAVGLGIASGPSYGALLLWPMACLISVVVRHGRALLRAIRRFRGLVLPFRSVTLRLLPWAGVTMTALLAAAALLSQDRRLVATEGLAPLIPASTIGGLAMLALALLGGLRFTRRFLIDRLRGRWLDARGVLWIYCAAVLILHALRSRVLDSLPAAPAIAILIGEGTQLVVWFALGRLSSSPNYS